MLSLGHLNGYKKWFSVSTAERLWTCSVFCHSLRPLNQFSDLNSLLDKWLIKTDQRTRSASFLPSYRVDVGKLTSIPLVEIASAFYIFTKLSSVFYFFEFLTHRVNSFLPYNPKSKANVSDSWPVDLVA